MKVELFQWDKGYISLHTFLPNSEYKISFGNGDFKEDTNDLIKKKIKKIYTIYLNYLIYV